MVKTHAIASNATNPNASFLDGTAQTSEILYIFLKVSWFWFPKQAMCHGSDIMGYEAWPKFHKIMYKVADKCKRIIAISNNSKDVITNIEVESDLLIKFSFLHLFLLFIIQYRIYFIIFWQI